MESEEEKDKLPEQSLRRLRGLVPSGVTLQECGDLTALTFLGALFEQRQESETAPLPTSVWLPEKLLMVRRKDGQVTPLKANRAQLSYERNRGRHNIVLKARQMGISTWIAGRMFLRTILQPGTLSVQVAHNQGAAEQLFRIVQRFYSHLPQELRNTVLKCSRNNRRQLAFSVIDSEYRVESAADVNAGRGLTIQNLHCSEVARWPRDAAETLAGLKAALSPHGELVLESTPMGTQGCFYQTWMESRPSAMVRHFFPWWWEASYVGPAVPPDEQTEEERALTKRAGLSAEQIGFRRSLQLQYRGMMAQEYAEDPDSCFLASGNCVFDALHIDRLLQEAAEPVSKAENGQLWVWLAAREGRRYIMGVDPAGGGGEGDFSALQVVDIETGLQCAEWQGRMPLREAAQVVMRAAEKYNGALIAVERNNHGSGLLAHLENSGARLYEHAGVAGWPTTSLTRPVMVERAGMALMENKFQSARLLRECKTFIRQPNGKAAAAAGSHDDCLMAMAVALSVREEVLQGGKKQRAH